MDITSIAAQAGGVPGGAAGGLAGGSTGPLSATSLGAPDTLGGATSPVAQVEAGYSTNLSASGTKFAESLERVRSVSEPSAMGKAMVAPLDRIDGEARALADYAESALASGNELTPSEIVTLTTKSHEFMFHAQLTTNMANRTADGLQQLLRQQG